MKEINGVVYLEIADCMPRLPWIMSERTFRQLVRAAGAGVEHRKQLALTEADLQKTIEFKRTWKTPCSSSSAGRPRRSGTSRVPSAANAISRARELLQEPTPKRTGRSGSARS